MRALEPFPRDENKPDAFRHVRPCRSAGQRQRTYQSEGTTKALALSGFPLSQTTKKEDNHRTPLSRDLMVISPSHEEIIP